MSKEDFEKIFEVSRSIKKMIRDHSAADSILVSHAWKLSCGDIIFSRTHLSEIKDEELIVEVDGDRWYQELHRIKGDLIVRLNELLGGQRFKRMILKKRGAV